MIDFFRKLFDTDFMPHGHCYYWQPEIVWLHKISDGLIALAYFSIPLLLFYFLRQRKDLPFKGLVWLFAAFILACGTTHLLAIYTISTPVYRLEGVVKLLTAGVSVATAVVLVPVIPKALALRSPKEVEEAGVELKRQLAQAMNVHEDLDEERYKGEGLDHLIKERTRELYLSEQQFRGLFEAAALGMALVSLEGRWMKVNQALCEIVGYAEKELLKTDFQTITHPEDLNSNLELVRQLTAGEIPYYHLEKRYFHKEGHVVWVLLSVTLVRNRRGEPLHFVAQIRDITRRRKAENEREALLRNLKIKTRELEQIVYVSSHDLRSPLVNIQGFSSELEFLCNELKDYLDQDSEESKAEVKRIVEKEMPDSVNFILASVSKMDGLLNGLLKLSRVGRAEIEWGHVDMNRLMTMVTDSLGFQIKELDIDMEVGDLPSCVGDEGQLGQVFTNLIDNAIKYRKTGHPCCITVTGESNGKEAIYRVKDNGSGVSKLHQKQIFEIFHRLEPGKSEGEGLGLTIVQRIVQKHGGEITLESEIGEGSCFIIRLPLNAGKSHHPFYWRQIEEAGRAKNNG